MAMTTANPFRIEWKVIAATVATYVGTALAVVLVQVLQDGTLIDALPPTGAAILAPFAPTLLTLLAGYLAKHTPRPGDRLPPPPAAPYRDQEA